MNKRILAVVIVGLLTATGAFVVFGGDEEEVATSTQPTSQIPQAAPSPTSTKSQEPETVETTSTGQYVDYSETVLADTANTERVLFFHAEWCSVCNFHEGQIEQTGVPEGITVIKADYDTEDALKDQYGVTVQSTFVWLDENGDAKQSWPFATGLRTPQDLFAVVQAG